MKGYRLVPLKRLRLNAARRTAGAVPLVLALVGSATASAQDGGVPDAGTGWNAPLYSVCPDAPPAEPLEGGSWRLSAARGARNACLAETCAARLRELEQAPAPAPILSVPAQVWSWCLLALGLIGGIYLGVQLRGLFPR